jgi:hypothetical protein
VIATEQDAKDLVRHFNRLGLAAVDLGQALAEARARADAQPTYPPLKAALQSFLDEQVEFGNLRASTAAAYRNRLATWAFPRIGATLWNLLTREDIGAVLLAIRKAGRSAVSVEQVRSPLARFYAWQINVRGLCRDEFGVGPPLLRGQAAVEEGPQARRPVVPAS